MALTLPLRCQCTESPCFALTRNTLIYHRLFGWCFWPLKVLEAEAQRMLNAGIIIPDSPLWPFLAVIALKKYGKRGFCVDYSLFYQVTKK